MAKRRGRKAPGPQVRRCLYCLEVTHSPKNVRYVPAEQTGVVEDEQGETFPVYASSRMPHHPRLVHHLGVEVLPLCELVRRGHERQWRASR